MDIVIRIFAFLGTVGSFAGAVYIFMSNREMRKMKKVNRELNEYIMGEGFLLMINGEETPYDTLEHFEMPSFSQEGDYIIRRKL